MMARSPGRCVLVLAGLVVTMSGCGGGPSAKSIAARAALSADVATLQHAATAGTAAEVARAAAALQADLTQQQKAGAVSADRATAIRDQLSRVLADVAVRTTPKPTAPQATTAPQPAPAGKGKSEDKGKGDEHGD